METFCSFCDLFTFQISKWRSLSLIFLLSGFSEYCGLSLSVSKLLHLLSTLEKMGGCSNEFGKISGVQGQGQALSCSAAYPAASLGKSPVLLLLFLHPCLRITSSLEESLAFSCWRLSNLSLSYCLSGRVAVNKGSGVCSSSGCPGKKALYSFLHYGNGKVEMKDASLQCWSQVFL